jgi:cytochrome c-type biogenesis protein CcmH/NrfG
VEDALQAYQRAARIAPNMDELPFWEAVTMADIGRSMTLYRSSGWYLP